MKTKKKIFRKLLRIFLCLCIVGISALLIMNTIVKGTTKDQILQSGEAAQIEDVDCILVLGCWVNEHGQPSSMLRDRLTRGVELYDLGAAPKLLMSGDHGRENYDEVDAMKRYALEAGVPSADVFMDHAGFSTYDSIWRAKNVYDAKKIIIVTQKYHLYRALYIAEKLGVEAYGVSADLRSYTKQLKYDMREILARVKDVFWVEYNRS